MRLRRASRTSLRRVAALGIVLGLLTAACGGAERSAEFCEKLSEVTGPAGVESILVPGDPERIEGVVAELDELHERAPDEISSTTRTLVNFFDSYQRAARDERRDVIADNEVALAQASEALNAYALRECGLFLERVPPTPIPTANPSIEAPDE